MGRALNRPVHRVFSPADLPRIVYIFWDKGIENAPEICRYCANSWKTKNPDWDIRIIDADVARKVVNPAILPAELTVQAYSDYLRVKLLENTGGVWVDATCLCARPLDEWLVPLFGQTDFFCFSRPGPDRMISSWFLAATPRSWVIQRFAKAVEDYWAGETISSPPYFWFHYLFEALALRDRQFHEQVEAMPKLSATVPHILQRQLQKKNYSKAELAAAKSSYVHKLTHKGEFDLSDVKRVISEPVEI